MAGNMNSASHNFEELTNFWSAADNVYGTGFQLADSSPQQIFDIAFSDTSNKFFDDLLTNKHSSSNVEIEYHIKPWNHKASTNSNIHIKQRKLNIKATESGGINFFLRKNLIANVTQTAFFEHDCITIYSVAQTRVENNKDTKHTMIDRWTIKRADADGHRIYISINANICMPSNSPPPASKALVKSKWLRFYQSRLETWKQLMTEQINAEKLKAEKARSMEAYLGVWNKLKSFHTIQIKVDGIEYSDGSRFGVEVNEDTNEIIAIYVSSRFRGKLHRGVDHEYIAWSNGSVWIRNGFQRFEGQYVHHSTEQKYTLHRNGTLKLPITGRTVRFQLLEANRISYQFNRDIVHKGTLCETRHIQWDNGSFWQRVDGSSVPPAVRHVRPPGAVVVDQAKHVAVKASDAEPGKCNQEEEQDEEHEDDEKAEELVEGAAGTATLEVEGEGAVGDGQQTQTVEEECCVEEDYDIVFKEKHGQTLEIGSDAHFVLVNDDELFGDEHDEEEQENMQDKPDEWLFV